MSVLLETRLAGAVERVVDAGGGAKPAYVTAGESVSYDELRRRVNRMGRLLRDLGVRREERVLLVLDDTPAFPVAFLGCMRIGAIPVPVGLREAPERYRHYVLDSYAAVVVCEAATVRTLQEALGGIQVTLVARGECAGAIDLDAALEDQDAELSPASAHPDDVAFWLYSSGSTGVPKGVVHLHRSVGAACDGFATHVLGVTAEDRLFSTSKLHHAYGLGNGLLFPMCFGGTSVLLDAPPRPEQILRLAEEHRPTLFFSVPAIYSLLAEEREARSAFGSVRLCVSAAETLAPETGTRWRERVGVEIVDGIGSTEMLQCYCSNRAGDVVPGTVGTPVPGYALRLVDADGRVLDGPGAGELHVRGDSRAACYWHQHDQDRRRMLGEWFATGDRLDRTADGRYRYVGRTDDMFKVGGLWVSPSDVESVLREHPSVADVAVVAATAGERTRIVACVQPARDVEADDTLSEQLREWCAGRTREAPGLVRFTANLPRTPNGKLRRQALRDSIEREMEGELAAAEWVRSDADADHTGRGGTSGPRSDRAIVDLVLSEAARAIGVPVLSAGQTGRPFKALGLDSVGALALRRALIDATGLDLPSTLVYDHPTPADAARHIERLMDGRAAVSPVPAAPRGDRSEPIAIVGVACRFPGGIASAGDLWDLVSTGGTVMSGFPSDRGWDIDGLFDPDPDREGCAYVREGGFLRDAAEFDAGFFGISPREALAMDPQQRLTLTVASEALETAGIDASRLRGSPTGVFVGAMASRYGVGAAAPGLEGHRLTGDAASALSGRVSYVFGLEGPALTLDTACSSSLVALHLACASLRTGESSLALAAGVTVMATPDPFVQFSRQRGLAPDARAKAFAAGADGTAFSEGVAVLVVERLSDAVAHRRRIWGVVAGSAINQDGASNGLTAPSGPAQERVIRQALVNAGLTAGDVDAVEAHGTGTALGDPIEAGALVAAYGRDRAAPLWLGSVKSNLGHTQAAAGMAGVIKMALAMRHGVLPATLHVEAPSEHVDWESGALRLLTERVEWPRRAGPRRAAISSFGVSGTNAHVILEEPPEVAERVKAPRPAAVALPLSGHTRSVLARQAERLAVHLRTSAAAELADVGFTLATGRAGREHRALVVAGHAEAAAEALDSVATGTTAAASAVVAGVADIHGGAVFVFPGQGSQWDGMAVELLDQSRVFAAHIRACGQALGAFVDWSLEDVLRGRPGAPRLDRDDVVQPALFAVMISLARLWEACGLRPEKVVGHSQGEIAAAHVAGALSLHDAARIVVLRSKALRRISGLGGLLSVGVGTAAATELLAPWADELSIGAFNGPASSVVSGGAGALAELAARCGELGIRCRTLAVDYASHSPQVDTLRGELMDVLAPIEPTACDVPFVSTVALGEVEGHELGAGYWFANLRDPVRFEPVIRELVGHGHRAFIEMSAHPVLTMAISETVEDALENAADALVLGTLRREEGSLARFLTSAGQAWTRGLPVAFDRLSDPGAAQLVDLPCTPFDGRHYWLEASSSPGGPSVDLESADHPLLGAGLQVADADRTVFLGRVSTSTHEWLNDHAVDGVVLLPGSALVDLALCAGKATDCPEVAELSLVAPVVLPDSRPLHLQVVVGTAAHDGVRDVTIHSRRSSEDAWTCHADGLVRPDSRAPFAAAGGWPPAGDPIDVTGLYARLRAAGYEYGPAFSGVRAAWRAEDVVWAEIAVAPLPTGRSGGFVVDPAALDAALQLGLLSGEESSLRLPFTWTGVRRGPATGPPRRARMTPRPDGGARFDLFDDAGHCCASVDSVVMRDVPGRLGDTARHGELLAVTWEPPEAVETLDGRRVVVVGDAPAPWPDGTRTARDLPDAVADAAESIVVRVRPPAGDVVSAVHAVAAEVLELIQRFVGEPGPRATRLVVLTERAIAVGDRDECDLTVAPLAGLLRTARLEYPGRVAHVDVDGLPSSWERLPQAIAATSRGELAVRDGRVLAPRLTPAGTAPTSPPLEEEGTVLITGGMSGIGARVARHLAAARGVRNLVLLSRSGAAAPDAPALVAELEAQGCRVTVAACDAADRRALAAVLAAIPAERPLTAVIHSAAVLDDGVLADLTPERMRTVMKPKVDAAWHLHELTAPTLAAFVCFSSIAGTLGGPGQGNYAAANAFVEALAAHRRHLGRNATSVAWGLWGEGTGLTAGLRDHDTERIARTGIAPLPAAVGLAMLDMAMDASAGSVLAVSLDRRALREQASTGQVPELLATLPVGSSRDAPGSLAGGITSLGADDRERAVLDLVADVTAVVLGHAGGEAIDVDRPFKDLGLDSLAALELRNRIGAATELRLETTLMFDHPTPRLVARHVSGALCPAADAAEATAGIDGMDLADLVRRAHAGARGTDTA